VFLLLLFFLDKKLTNPDSYRDKEFAVGDSLAGSFPIYESPVLGKSFIKEPKVLDSASCYGRFLEALYFPAPYCASPIMYS
jgi:hypothetical protein